MSTTERVPCRITKRPVDHLKPGELVWDAEVKEFGVRCQRSAKTCALKTRIGGRQRWITIGRHGSPWTPDTARREAHFVGLPRAWERIRSKADLNDVHLHGLRHSFASVAADAGGRLLVIGSLLGHRDQAATQRTEPHYAEVIFV